MASPPAPLTFTDGHEPPWRDLTFMSAGDDGVRVETYDGFDDVRCPLDLTRLQVLSLIGWLGRAISAEPCHLPSCSHLPPAPAVGDPR